MDSRNESESEGTAVEPCDPVGKIDPDDQLPLSFEINWTASRLPSLLIEPAVSLHKFTFTTSFSIGPTLPAPDGDEIAGLFGDEYTVVGGGQFNDETVLVATSTTSDVRIAIDGRHVDVLVAASSFKMARDVGLGLKERFPKAEKRPDVLMVRTWYAGYQGVTSSYSDLILPSWDEIAPQLPRANPFTTQRANGARAAVTRFVTGKADLVPRPARVRKDIRNSCPVPIMVRVVRPRTADRSRVRFR